jgi:hypothetical protein
LGIISSSRLIRDFIEKHVAKQTGLCWFGPATDAAQLPDPVDVVAIDAQDVNESTLSRLSQHTPRPRLVVINADWDDLDIAASLKAGALVQGLPEDRFQSQALANRRQIHLRNQNAHAQHGSVSAPMTLIMAKGMLPFIRDFPLTGV